MLHLNFILGVAIRCYVCSSLYDERCDDQHFVGDPTYMYDCSSDPLRGIIPVQHCRKAKYFSNSLNACCFSQSKNWFFSLIISANNKWVYVRSCNKRDNLTEAKDAEAYHADFCNSANKFNQKIPILLLVVFVARYLLHWIFVKWIFVWCIKWLIE